MAVEKMVKKRGKTPQFVFHFNIIFILVVASFRLILYLNSNVIDNVMQY